jgi:hypothetical protein
MEYSDAVDEETGYYAPGTYGNGLSVAVCAFEGCEKVRMVSNPDLSDLIGWGTLRFITLTGSDVPGKRTTSEKLAFCPEHFIAVISTHRRWFDEKEKKQGFANTSCPAGSQGVIGPSGPPAGSQGVIGPSGPPAGSQGVIGPSGPSAPPCSSGATCFTGVPIEYTPAQLAEFAERYYGDDCEDWND